MITLDQIKTLWHGATFHHVSATNRDGTPLRCRINGKVKVWKTLPAELSDELKYLKQCGRKDPDTGYIKERIAEIESMRGKCWRLPVKYGMYDCFYIGNVIDCDNPEMWELGES